MHLHGEINLRIPLTAGSMRTDAKPNLEEPRSQR